MKEIKSHISSIVDSSSRKPMEEDGGHEGVSTSFTSTTINGIGNCDSNLCFNGGICDPVSQKCKCRGHFIGK